MQQLDPPEERKPSGRTTTYFAELQCFMCGSPAGSIESEQNPAAHGVWHPVGDGPVRRLADWRQLHCQRCGGALYVESVESVLRHEPAPARREAPRRGRPPKWLIEERRRDPGPLKGRSPRA